MKLRKLRDQDSSQWIRTADGGVLVPLTQGFTATIDAEDVPHVEKHLWCVMRSKKTNYAATGRAPNGVVLLHRFLAGKPGLTVDHRDRNGLNNRRSNLREATYAQNIHNTIQYNGPTYKGVYQQSESRKYFARIQIDRKVTYGIMRASAEEAAVDYDVLALHHRGEFAWLNFPEKAHEVLREKGVEFLSGMHPATKLDPDAVRAIRKQHEEGKSLTQLAKIYGVSWGNIGLICRRKTWRHVI